MERLEGLEFVDYDEYGNEIYSDETTLYCLTSDGSLEPCGEVWEVTEEELERLFNAQ